MSHSLVVNINAGKAYDVYIGRAGHGYDGFWGNPFVEGVHGTRAEVIAQFREHVLRSPGMRARLPELRGKVLGCFCSPKPCHGDVLAELANPGGEGQTSLFGGE